MKLNAKINDKTYNVEIEDLNARPVVAFVDGERVEVMPESAEQPPVRKESVTTPAREVRPVITSAPADGNVLPSPLPGTIAEIFVKVGDEIESGQVVLVIEAMKMKNSIRSPRSGKLMAILAEAGQIVQHKQPLLEFES